MNWFTIKPDDISTKQNKKGLLEKCQKKFEKELKKAIKKSRRNKWN